MLPLCPWPSILGSCVTGHLPQSRSPKLPPQATLLGTCESYLLPESGLTLPGQVMQDLWEDSAKSILPKLPRTPGHNCCVTMPGPQFQKCLDTLIGMRKLGRGTGVVCPLIGLFRD